MVFILVGQYGNTFGYTFGGTCGGSTMINSKGIFIY